MNIDDLFKNDSIKMSIDELQDELNRQAEESLRNQYKELKPIRNAAIGVLRAKMVEEIEQLRQDDFEGSLKNLKLILDVIELLKSENSEYEDD